MVDFARTRYEYDERSEIDPDAPQHRTDMLSEDQGPDIIKDAAMIRMQKLAQKIYDTTPGINTRKSPFLLV